MTNRGKEKGGFAVLRKQLKALSNRYAIDILRVLSPETGEMVPALTWDEIFDGILRLSGLKAPKKTGGMKTQEEANYQKRRSSLMSGGTIYETMNKLIKAEFVQAEGSRGKKNRQFMITPQGRLALSAMSGLLGPTDADTEVQKAAKILLKHKNFISLLPAQEKFIREIESIDSNMIIQMPPGSGKTFLAMIVALLNLQKGTRCLYITPYNSLNRQIIDEYGDIFQELGYSMMRYDGQIRTPSDELKDADMVVSVYESFLGAVLKNRLWTQGLGLVVIDELTELDSSGPVMQARNLGTDRSTKLDCLISLLKDDMRILTLSSRFGDTEDIAEWLDATVFRPSFRLVPDEFIANIQNKYTEIYSSDGTQHMRYDVDNATDAILQHMGEYKEKSMLFVVGTRFDAESLAHRLSSEFPRDISEDVIDMIGMPDTNLPVTQRLLGILSKGGTAFHHSGLTPRVRAQLERFIRKGAIRTVVSTTGITAGMSFPFDAVVIYFDRSLYYISARSRYLQIAGRIGEYHLAKHGGRVYLVFLGARQFQDAKDMENTLLHHPLEPLSPGVLYPSLVANLMMREAEKKRSTSRKKLREQFMQIVKGSLKGTIDDKYEKHMEKMYEQLIKWAIFEKLLIEKDDKLTLNKEVKSAVKSGLGVIDYVKVRSTLDTLTEAATDDELIDLILKFEIPQSIRPKTSLPTKIEIDASGLEAPEDWYKDLVKQREEVKKRALKFWIDEYDVTDVLKEARLVADSIQVGGRPFGGVSVEDGDLDYFVEICYNLAYDLTRFLESIKRKKAASRMKQFSRQIRYGVKDDLAESDLMDLRIRMDGESFMPMSRPVARTLFDNGYRSLTEVVRKEIDPEKEGLARDRFAKKSGLDTKFAKTVYKAAMDHLRGSSA